MIRTRLHSRLYFLEKYPRSKNQFFKKNTEISICNLATNTSVAGVTRGESIWRDFVPCVFCKRKIPSPSEEMVIAILLQSLNCIFLYLRCYLNGPSKFSGKIQTQQRSSLWREIQFDSLSSFPIYFLFESTSISSVLQEFKTFQAQLVGGCGVVHIYGRAEWDGWIISERGWGWGGTWRGTYGLVCRNQGSNRAANWFPPLHSRYRQKHWNKPNQMNQEGEEVAANAADNELDPLSGVRSMDKCSNNKGS